MLPPQQQATELLRAYTQGRYARFVDLTYPEVVTLAGGPSGFGASSLTHQSAESLLGRDFAELFDPESGVRAEWRFAEYPIWDLAGKLAGQPV